MGVQVVFGRSDRGDTGGPRTRPAESLPVRLSLAAERRRLSTGSRYGPHRDGVPVRPRSPLPETGTNLTSTDEHDHPAVSRKGADSRASDGRSQLPAAPRVTPPADRSALAGELAAAEERLQEIQSIMESALHHLDVDDLLPILLDRVLEILSSDTGDVGGHGLRPAVVMGRLRSALRAYAFEGWPAEKVLHLADQKLQHFEDGVTATVVCAVFSPPFDHFHLALAGHPPPVLAVPGQAPLLLDIAPAPLFGATTCPGPSATRIEMPPDSVLVLYTDGLIERRDEPLDQGLERLRSVVTPDDPEAVCRRITDALIGDWSPQDDVALLALQRRLPPTERGPRGSRLERQVSGTRGTM